MISDSLASAIVGHLVGDYLLQTDWMAMNKKKWSLVGASACLVHASIWTLSVCLFAGWSIQGLFPAILFLTHFWQDKTQAIGWWMRLPWKNQSGFAEPPMAPWSLIVVDNVWHIVVIWVVWKFMV